MRSWDTLFLRMRGNQFVPVTSCICRQYLYCTVSHSTTIHRNPSTMVVIPRESLLTSIPVELPPIIPLTTNASSWLLHLPRFCRSPNQHAFLQLFQTHPPNQHALQLYGKRVFENRYSQMFVTDDSVGSTYKYSGTTRPCHVCDPQKDEEQFLLDLCTISNILYSKMIENNIIIENTGTTKNNPYNCCLVNWYQPHHHIGLHADDEKELNLSIPIISLSWGGPRRFLLRPKPTTKNLSGVWKKNSTFYEICLKDGDLLLMGGKCQQEFKHEIPKVRKMDGIVGPRISWTIRSMYCQSDQRGTTGSSQTPQIKKRRIYKEEGDGPPPQHHDSEECSNEESRRVEES